MYNYIIIVHTIMIQVKSCYICSSNSEEIITNLERNIINLAILTKEINVLLFVRI